MTVKSIDFTKKELVIFGVKAVILAVALAGHFFLVQAKVETLIEKMGRMEAAYQEVIEEQHQEKIISEAVRARYIAQIEGNTRRVEVLEVQVQDLRETNREILTILRGRGRGQ